MRLIFAGTPEFAATALRSLIAAGHELALVLTQPDRPAGRGLKPAPSPVKTLALAHGLALRQPATLRDPAEQAPLRAVGADAMVVAAYGLILPQAVLDIPRLGCLNIHASLLPRWRGAAPIQRAILAGDARTGITIMQMDAGLDTGDMLLAEDVAIEVDDTAGTLHDKLAGLGARCIVRALEQLGRGALARRPQGEEGASYAPKISRQEAALDWRRDAAELARAVRAFDPFPGSWSELNGNAVKIWRASALAAGAGAPGEVLAAGREGILVACGDGALRLEVLQRAGGRRLAAAEFLAGYPLAPGARFGAADA
ncbi:MAG TPA: methionyl-tRNA formyltransferase [Burkholderiales bacterium]|nr:methionyl-tRNA formyltransferase [Burkholderiales bacterium]